MRVNILYYNIGKLSFYPLDNIAAAVALAISIAALLGTNSLTIFWSIGTICQATVSKLSGNLQAVVMQLSGSNHVLSSGSHKV